VDKEEVGSCLPLLGISREKKVWGKKGKKKGERFGLSPSLSGERRGEGALDPYSPLGKEKSQREGGEFVPASFVDGEKGSIKGVARRSGRKCEKLKGKMVDAYFFSWGQAK